MALINTNTTPATYPLTELDFRTAYANVSFPNPIPEAEFAARGWYTVQPVTPPEWTYDPATQALEPVGDPAPNADGTAYVQAFRVVDLPLDEILKNIKPPKLAEFDVFFVRLDALKIRPAAAIAEALAAGDPAPIGDAYRLSELEAITTENRALREMVQAAETVEEVRAVNVWWPTTPQETSCK